MIRSWLFVPGDSERKLARAPDAGADALIVDLEDAVAAAARPAARRLASEFVQGRDDAWVRINPIETDDADDDLEAVMPSAPAGIVLPKPWGANDALALANRLDRLEREYDLEQGSTRILPLVTERPAALFSLNDYARSTPRLAALSWGAEDLGAAIGAQANRDGDGRWLPPYELARTLCLVAAAAAEVPAIDTVFTDYRDADGLARYAANAARDGFAGMLAIHPAQVAVINDAFSPGVAVVERARRIVRLFEENPQAGTLGLDGEMIDRPHLLQARRIVALAAEIEAKKDKAKKL